MVDVQDNVPSLVNVAAEEIEVWLKEATLEMDGGVGRGLTQSSEASNVHVQGTGSYCSNSNSKFEVIADFSVQPCG